MLLPRWGEREVCYCFFLVLILVYILSCLCHLQRGSSRIYLSCTTYYSPHIHTYIYTTILYSYTPLFTGVDEHDGDADSEQGEEQDLQLITDNSTHSLTDSSKHSTLPNFSSHSIRNKDRIKNITEHIDDDDVYITMPILHTTSFIANRKDDDGQPRGPKGKRMSQSVIIMASLCFVYSLYMRL